jgi:hypothetical protein
MSEEILRPVLPFWYTLFRDEPITATLLLLLRLSIIEFSRRLIFRLSRDKPITAILLLLLLRLSIIEFSRRRIFGRSNIVSQHLLDYQRGATFPDHRINAKGSCDNVLSLLEYCVPSTRKPKLLKHKFQYSRPIKCPYPDFTGNSLDRITGKSVDSIASKSLQSPDRIKFQALEDIVLQQRKTVDRSRMLFRKRLLLHHLLTRPSIKYPIIGGCWSNVNSIKQQLHDFITHIGYHLSPVLGYLSVFASASITSILWRILWKTNMVQTLLRSLAQMDRAGVG